MCRLDFYLQKKLVLCKRKHMKRGKSKMRQSKRKRIVFIVTVISIIVVLGTSIDTLLLCYCTKYFDFRYSYIKSGIIYTLWGLSIIVLNLLSCPFIFKLIYELFSIIFLNRYLYFDFQLKSTLKMIVVFYIVLFMIKNKM